MPFTQYDTAPLQGAALWGFLEKARTMRLATVNADEAIEVSPVWFVVRNETVYFPIDPTIGDPGRSTTPAWRHLQALDSGGRVSAVIDDGEDLSNFRGVQFAGKAAKVEDADLKEELLDLTLEKYFFMAHPHLEHYLSRGMMEARLWYRLIHERVAGWDRRYLPQAPIMDRRVLPPFLRKAK
ncbi:MAG TPA: pyridoxamine 5'-phosphate oxidase family protein [Candidatus Binataceae bacterium]|nr:pyridoxamine 5'-phosphate oxidase family protein [Candidatus Binataceae bacterium]